MPAQGLRPPPAAKKVALGALAGRLQVVLRQKLGQRLIGDPGRNPPLQQLAPQPVPPLASQLDPRFDEAAGRRPVVEVALLGETVQRRLDLLPGEAALRELRRQLPPEVRPERQ